MASNLVALLTKLLVVLIFLRLCVELLPRWLLIVIGVLVMLSFEVLSPQVTRQMRDASSGLIEALIPFLVLLVAFRIVTSGMFGGKRR